MSGAVLACLIGGTLAATPPAGALHNKHLSHARVVLEDATILARIRMFRDDLEKALGHKVADDSASKALVAAYVTRQFGIRADGVALEAEFLDQGADTDGDQPVWWVLGRWTAARAPRQLAFRDHLLFDLFADQQNLMVFARMPQDERRTLYFQPGDRSEQIVRW